MKIIFFDPGGVTGWATFSAREVEGPDGIEYYNMEFAIGQIEHPDHHTTIERLIGIQHSDFDYTVGFERWHLQKKDDGSEREGLDFMAPEYIGAIKLASALRPGPLNLVSQMPHERKFADKRKMEIFNLWSLTNGRKDARAAAQHLLTYLIKTMEYPPIMRQLQLGLLV